MVFSVLPAEMEGKDKWGHTSRDVSTWEMMKSVCVCVLEIKHANKTDRNGGMGVTHVQDKHRWEEGRGMWSDKAGGTKRVTSVGGKKTSCKVKQDLEHLSVFSAAFTPRSLWHLTFSFLSCFVPLASSPFFTPLHLLLLYLLSDWRRATPSPGKHATH